MTVAQAETSLVMAGDSITISVWGYPEFTTRALVKRSGTITISLIGEVMAAGYTREEFTLNLRRRLAEFIQGEIKLLVEILGPPPQITVLGTVWRQGSFPANRDVPLLELLSNVGGWTETSDLRHLKISRQATRGSDEGTVEVDLQWYLESGNIRSLPVVHPGDVVYVPKKENAVREAAEYLRDAFLLFGFFRLFN
jgi:polysaccharide export outer membrane protein